MITGNRQADVDAIQRKQRKSAPESHRLAKLAHILLILSRDRDHVRRTQSTDVELECSDDKRLVERAWRGT